MRDASTPGQCEALRAVHTEAVLACQKIRQQSPARCTQGLLVECRQVVDVSRFRRWRPGRVCALAIALPARQRPQRAETELAVDALTGWCCIEIRRATCGLDGAQAVGKNRAAQPLATGLGRDQDHADPGDLFPDRQHGAAGDDATLRIAHAKHRAGAGEEGPVRRGLVPAAAEHQRVEHGLRGAAQDPECFDRDINTCHRVLRTWSVCRRGVARAKSSPRPNPSAVTGVPADSQTGAQPRPCS